MTEDRLEAIRQRHGPCHPEHCFWYGQVHEARVKPDCDALTLLAALAAVTEERDDQRQAADILSADRDRLLADIAATRQEGHDLRAERDAAREALAAAQTLVAFIEDELIMYVDDELGPRPVMDVAMAQRLEDLAEGLHDALAHRSLR